MRHTGTFAKRVHRILVLSLSFFILIALIPAFAQEGKAAAQIEHFSPQGTVKEIRQVTARFSEPMVSFGDPRLADPFDIRCAEKGQGRWIDARTWSYDFDRDLPGGVACSFTLKAGVKTLAGTPVAADAGFSFSTGGPSILRSNPYEGDTDIDEKQIFVLYLNAEPMQETLLKNVWFSVSGVGERVGVTLVTGKEREQILKTLRTIKMKERSLPSRQDRPFRPRQSSGSSGAKALPPRAGWRRRRTRSLNSRPAHPSARSSPARARRRAAPVSPFSPCASPSRRRCPGAWPRTSRSGAKTAKFGSRKPTGR